MERTAATEPNRRQAADAFIHCGLLWGDEDARTYARARGVTTLEMFLEDHRISYIEIEKWVSEPHDDYTDSTVASVFATFSTILTAAARAHDSRESV